MKGAGKVKSCKGEGGLLLLLISAEKKFENAVWNKKVFGLGNRYII